MDSAKVMGPKITGRAAAFISAAAERLIMLGGPAWKVLTFSPADDAVMPASCACISIESGGVAVAMVSRVLSHYGIKNFKKYSLAEGRYPRPDEVASAAALALRDLGAGKSTGIVLSIPKQWVVLKSVELPALVMENLHEVITHELDRITPFGSDEAFYDFLDVRREGEKVAFLVAAARADKVGGYLSALEGAGVAVERITFDLSGVSTLCRYRAGRDTFIFMEVDEDGIRGGAVCGGALVKVTHEKFDREDETSKAAMVTGRIAYLNGALQGHTNPPRVVLAFRGKTAAIKELLRKEEGLSLVFTDEMGKKILGTDNYKELSSAAVGGSMDHLWTKANGFNLLRKGVREKRKAPLVLTGALLLAIVAIAGAYLIIPISNEERQLHEIEKQIAMRKGEMKRVEELTKEIKALTGEIASINNFKSAQPMALDLIRELAVALPKDAWLTRIRIGEAQANIEGYAPSAAVLVPRLETAKHFRRVEFASPTFRDTRQNLDRFQIKMEIRETGGNRHEKQ